jgi:hypothetical protein
MDDKLIDAFRNSQGYWAPHHENEEVWADIKSRFAQMSPPDRHKMLYAVDSFFDPRDSDGNYKELHATKEAAAMLTKKRELESIHKLLWSANR